MNEITLIFDPERIIEAYRGLIRDLEITQITELRDEFQQIASRLRAVWKHYKGSDTLHETVFGSPQDSADELTSESD